MKWRKGPRPWTIWLFAVAWSFLAAENLLAALPPYSLWESNQKTVVGAFSIFTAGIIPVIAIFGFASRFALGFVTIMSLAFVATLLMQLWASLLIADVDIAVFAHHTAMLVLVAVLFHPTSRRWFRHGEKWSDPKLYS